MTAGAVKPLPVFYVYAVVDRATGEPVAVTLSRREGREYVNAQGNAGGLRVKRARMQVYPT